MKPFKTWLVFLMNKVHFNFVVDAGEAEFIFDALHDKKLGCLERLSGVGRDFVDRPLKDGEKKWNEGHAKFIEGIIEKMKNTPQ